jgi:DNA-binding MarR family transcriptional regulator
MYTYKKSQPKQKGNFNTIPPQIDQIKELTGDQKRILSQIIFFEGLTKPGEVKEHRPKNKYLAKIIYKSERTVTRCIKKLEELGYLAVTIYDNCDRALTLCTEKIAKIMSNTLDKVSKVIDDLSSTVGANIQSMKGKVRSFFPTKDIKDIYKKGFNKYEENRGCEIRLYQEDNQSREEFDKICQYRESLGDVQVDRIYSTAKNNLKINVMELLKQGYNRSRNQTNI